MKLLRFYKFRNKRIWIKNLKSKNSN